MRILLALLLFPLLGFAQNELISEEDALGELKAIVFLSNWDQVERTPNETEGMISDGVDLLNLNTYFLKDLGHRYIGKSFTLGTVWDIQQQVTEFYRSQNQPFAVVSIPRQEWTQGVVQFVVEEARLGEVRVVGNRYNAASYLADKIQTKPGQPIITKEILEDLTWLNQNPFRRVDAMFTPGQLPGTADLELITVDRWPYRFYTGADNTGTIATDRTRLFLGFNFGNTIWRDAQLSYQFTCAPNWNRFFSHTAMYRLPFQWRHTAIFYAGYSQVEPDISRGATEKGVGWQVNGRYHIPFTESPWLMQAISVGYDFKEVTNRILSSAGQRLFKGTADINQFALIYELGVKTKDLKLSFVLEAFGNPGGITTHNNSSSYEQFRYHAKSRYGYCKLNHSVARHKWGCWFSYNLTGQFATTNLLSSEQMTLSGYNAVRGYEERIVNVDNGALLNLEVESPRWSPAKAFGSKKVYDELYLLLFLDVAAGRNHIIASGARTWQYLSSIGPSLRYQYSRYVSAHFDYGVQLWHNGFSNPTDSRYNFGLTVSY